MAGLGLIGTALAGGAVGAGAAAMKYEEAAIQARRDKTLKELELKFAPQLEAAKRELLIAAGRAAEEEIAKREQPFTGADYNPSPGVPVSQKERGLIRSEKLTGAGYIQEGEAVRQGAMADLSTSEREKLADVRQGRGFAHARDLQELNQEFQIDLQAFQQQFTADENMQNREQASKIAGMQMGNALAIANAHAAPVQDSEGQFFVRTIGRNGATETSYLLGPDGKPMKGQKDMTAAQKALIEPVTVMIRETAKDATMDPKEKAANIAALYKEIQGIIQTGKTSGARPIPSAMDIEKLKSNAGNPMWIKAFEREFKTSAAYFLSGSDATKAAMAVTADMASAPKTAGPQTALERIPSPPPETLHRPGRMGSTEFSNPAYQEWVRLYKNKFEEQQRADELRIEERRQSIRDKFR